MSMASPRSFGPLPVCSQAGSRLAAFPVGRAERSERAEGKIKETGTLAGRFQGKPLSAHCFGAALAAPWFWISPLNILQTLALAYPLLPALPVIELLGSYLEITLLRALGPSLVVLLAAKLLAIVAANWFMIFRGFLYHELQRGSRRMSAYRRKM